MAEREEQYLGNYRLLDLLGRGDFGEVYLGEHVNLGIERAIKLMDMPVVGDEVAVFQQKASPLLTLVHPHIVRVLDFDVEAGTHKPYLVMDYAPNGTLRERHPTGTRLPLSTVVAYVKQIAAALQYAHEKGVIHLDVKPENILLAHNDELRLSDFGIARLSQPESTSGDAAYHAAGTPAYMAPEQIEGKPCPASDQYALAIMVYEWLCGERPFQGDQVLYQHRAIPPPPLHEKIPTISSAVEQVVLCALNKEPQQRFPSVEAFATALVSAIPAPEQSETVAPTSRTLITRRAVLFGAGGVVGLALLGTDIWWERMKASLLPQGTLYLTYRGHTGNVYSVVWSPNGKRIASGGADGTVQVWDAANGGNVFTFHGDSNYVETVAWSPNGKRIASAYIDGTVQVWDAVSGDHIYAYRGHASPVFSVAWSPDSKRIASASADRSVQEWDAANGWNSFTQRGYANYVDAVAWSPDGKRIVSGSLDYTAQVWDAVNGSHIFIYRRHSNYVTAVAWSPDSQRIATASDDGTVQVWQGA